MKSKFSKKNIDEESNEDSEVTEDSLKVSATGNSESTRSQEIEEEADVSLFEKIKARLPFKKAEDPDAEEEGAPVKKVAAEKPANRRVIYLCVLIIMGVIFWEEIFPPEPEVTAPAPVVRKRPKKISAPDPAAAPESPPVEASAPTEAPVATTEESPTAAEPVPAATEEPNPTIEEIPDAEPTPTATTAEEPTPASVEGQAGEGSVSATQDSVDGDSATPSDENLTDKILQDLEKQAGATQKKEGKTEYVAPPDYEYKGRGLVYNCTGKHWACVDAPSYKTCEDNSSSTKFLGKKNECFPFNIYETQRGCESMQNRMVSSNAKTNFCTEK